MAVSAELGRFKPADTVYLVSPLGEESHEEITRLRDWRHDFATPLLISHTELLKVLERRLDAMEPRLDAIARADEIAEAVQARLQRHRQGLMTAGEKVIAALVGIAAVADFVLRLVQH